VAAVALGAALLVVLLPHGSNTIGSPARPPAPTAGTRLLVGVDDDTLKWSDRPRAVVRRQQALGAEGVRVWVPWEGEARPAPVRRVELARAEVAARRTQVVLAVFGLARVTPADGPSRERFCRYAADALARVPDAAAVVVWNEANSATYWNGTPEGYERLLARCYDLLHAVGAGVSVLDSTASAHGPASFLEAVAAAYRASGRDRPLVDGFGHNPYPRSSAEPPGATHAAGFLGEGDYPRLHELLARAFAGTAQASFAVWYLEDGYQSAPPPSLLGAYDGRENAQTVTAALQAERLRSAILLAACQPGVQAFFNFELVDEPRLAGWQSGLLWQGSSPKPAAAAFAAAASAARRGGADCTGPAGAAGERP
jgi:hypothetical protein